MQIAEILSDLTSLRAADHDAAMAFVSARPQPTTATSSSSAAAAAYPEGMKPPPQAASRSSQTSQQLDPELQRAKDLIELHYSVKVAHMEGRLETQLDEAKERVRKAVEGLGMRV